VEMSIRITSANYAAQSNICRKHPSVFSLPLKDCGEDPNTILVEHLPCCAAAIPAFVDLLKFDCTALNLTPVCPRNP
jgi:hypothetical protein